jgi:hypothetical protein
MMATRSGFFAWESQKSAADLNEAFNQLLHDHGDLGSRPRLIIWAMDRIAIRTHFTGFLDGTEMDPSIFGSLFERILHPAACRVHDVTEAWRRTLDGETDCAADCVVHRILEQAQSARKYGTPWVARRAGPLNPTGAPAWGQEVEPRWTASTAERTARPGGPRGSGGRP